MYGLDKGSETLVMRDRGPDRQSPPQNHVLLRSEH